MSIPDRYDLRTIETGELEQASLWLVADGTDVPSFQHIVVDGPEYRVEKIGVPSEDFLARLAENPLPPLSREAADSWMADIRSAYADDDFVCDPYERFGC
ncbi:hypothetical protein [Frondihabitans sp. VKM Ac-2883]|uniref:hypothetical protein n=1 Tax=Frondihabitans sp. VKM Ac-2883 TaxID=2783823 RepID=UPI00188C2C0B|nr:hypothetical protein [Frondihabitans sp. VKM Ac-2883]MBF4577282.1 hypothetical protein [Frondihabitans sp. VKM Ac-2883]